MDGITSGMNTCGTTSKTAIVSLLSDVNRKGISNVIDYLHQSNYFTAHCHHHHRHEGGLADHSLDVYKRMRALAPDLSDESCRIVALFHDICTTRLEGYDIIAQNHHGQRSVDLLDALGFELHADERKAICQHMHHVPQYLFSEDTKIWHFLHLCDRQSANNHHYDYSSHEICY